MKKHIGKWNHAEQLDLLDKTPYINKNPFSKTMVKVSNFVVDF
jgi:hypothetical protein